jgi:hypothetical protein
MATCQWKIANLLGHFVRKSILGILPVVVVSEQGRAHNTGLKRAWVGERSAWQ